LPLRLGKVVCQFGGDCQVPWRIVTLLGLILTLPPAQPQGLTRSEFRLQAVRAALFQEAASTRDSDRGQCQDAHREQFLREFSAIRGGAPNCRMRSASATNPSPPPAIVSADPQLACAILLANCLKCHFSRVTPMPFTSPTILGCNSVPGARRGSLCRLNRPTRQVRQQFSPPGVQAKLRARKAVG